MQQVARQAETNETEDIWESFFNALFAVGERCLEMKLVDSKECVARASFLYTGLPALTILEGLVRSCHLPNKMAISLSITNQVITPETCPSEHSHLLAALLQTKWLLMENGLHGQSATAALQRLKLRALGRHRRQSNQQDDTSNDSNMSAVEKKVNASIQQLTAAVSKLPKYHERLTNVLNILGNLVSSQIQQQEEHKTHNQDVVLSQIWISFFNQSFHTGEEAIIGTDKILAKENCVDNDPFLYIGLPALTILDALHRSLSLADSEAIALAIGNVITDRNCPREHRPMFASLLKAKRLLYEAKLSAPEMARLRKMTAQQDTYMYTTAADDDVSSKTINTAAEYETTKRLNTIKAVVSGIAIMVSQLSFYHEQYNSVIARLAEVVP